MPGCHPGRGEVNGLLRRSALSVDGRRRHGLRQSGGNPPVARHVRALLAHLAHAAADDIVDPLGIDPGPLQERIQSEGKQVGRMPTGQGSAALAESGAQHIDDDGLSHGASSCIGADLSGHVAGSSMLLTAVAVASSRRAINDSTALLAPAGSPS